MHQVSNDIQRLLDALDSYLAEDTRLMTFKQRNDRQIQVSVLIGRLSLWRRTLQVWEREARAVLARPGLAA